MEKLMNQGCQLSNIEVTDGNIKSFEKCARKYSIDFSLKKTHPSPRPVILYFSRQRMWMS
nr:PcfB family protein [Sporofaciens musculi]